MINNFNQILLPKLKNILSKIEQSTEIIPQKFVERQDTFLIFNKNGTRPALLWCFNSWPEAFILSRRLGKNQPLVAMLSLKNFIKNEDEKNTLSDLIAIEYSRLITCHFNQKFIIIGGNCQGAGLAEKIFQERMLSYQNETLFISLNYEPLHSFSGNILMLFSAKTDECNPYLVYKDCEAKFKSKHARPSWGMIDSTHGTCFLEPGIIEFSKYISNTIEIYNERGQIDTGQIYV